MLWSSELRQCGIENKIEVINEQLKAIVKAWRGIIGLQKVQREITKVQRAERDLCLVQLLEDLRRAEEIGDTHVAYKVAKKLAGKGAGRAQPAPRVALDEEEWDFGLRRPGKER